MLQMKYWIGSGGSGGGLNLGMGLPKRMLHVCSLLRGVSTGKGDVDAWTLSGSWLSEMLSSPSCCSTSGTCLTVGERSMSTAVSSDEAVDGEKRPETRGSSEWIWNPIQMTGNGVGRMGAALMANKDLSEQLVSKRRLFSTKSHIQGYSQTMKHQSLMQSRSISPSVLQPSSRIWRHFQDNMRFYHQQNYHWATPTARNENDKKQWRLLAGQGYDVNPCNSPHHPAVEAGIELDSDSNEISVQEAYTPESSCFGCGPAALDGLHLRSFRVPQGLEATVTLDSKYCAFPGIINGGIITTIFDCHGNWTAAIALMDRGCLPKPLLTLTSEILVKFVEPTPPNQPLIVRSKIARIIESGEVGQKASVEVDMTLHLQEQGGEKLVAKSSGLFKKLGALRAL